jgi:predicted Zn finger-like uncharacterized protein
MILICPFCETRYDLGDGRRPSENARVRCRRCHETFRPGSGNGGSEAGTGQNGGGMVVVAAEAGPFRNLLCAILKKHGFVVKVTADGEQALEWVRKTRPQAVFAAVFLRRMLGITLSERIRSDPGLESTRVALIGHRLEGDRLTPDLEQLFGARCYLEETLGPEILFRRTASFLGTAGPGREDEPEADDDTEATAETALPADPPPAAAPDGTEEEIRRLGRIAASDLYLYYPSEVITAVQADHLEETFRDDIEKGKRLVEKRFPDVPAATDIFLHTMKECLIRTAGQTRT